MAGKVLFVGALLSLSCFAAAVSAFRSEDETKSLFERWLEENPRPYLGDLTDKNLRFEIFKSNLRIIDEHNAKDSTYKLGLNLFADLTPQEFKNQHLGYVGTAKLSSTPFRYANVTPPPAVNWTKAGAVTHVKNQGACGGCWAFAVIGGVEGIVKINTGKLISLSEQELLSCNDYNFGCGGGGDVGGFDWIVRNGGIDSEKDYNYTSGDGSTSTCNAKKVTTQYPEYFPRLKSRIPVINADWQRSCLYRFNGKILRAYLARPIENQTKVASIDGYEAVPQNNETALQQAVASQPVPIGFDAGLLQLYQGGVISGNYTTECNSGRDHAVVVIGYNSLKSGMDYWIIKNSWGAAWGEGGFFRIIRNLKNHPEGMCLLATDGAYPTIN